MASIDYDDTNELATWIGLAVWLDFLVYENTILGLYYMYIMLFPVAPR